MARYCQLGAAIMNNSELYSNTRSLLTSTFFLPSEEVAISAANYNYNHYNLPFSHIMIIVTISDEDMLWVKVPVIIRHAFMGVSPSRYLSHYVFLKQVHFTFAIPSKLSWI